MKWMCGAAALVFVCTLAPAAASARVDQDAFSLGFVLGEPTGLTLRKGLGDASAIQGHLGFDHFHGGGTTAILDWTYDAADLIGGRSRGALLFYLGLGGKADWFAHGYYEDWYDGHRRYYEDGHLGLGMRGLLGLRASFRPPVDVFLELAPVGLMFDVDDGYAYYDVDLALGARFRF
jgi:hypothetical protein